jgi:hypothetical protein
MRKRVDDELRHRGDLGCHLPVVLHRQRRLEKAIAAWDNPVKVRWLPFQLNSAMPKEGISRPDDDR